MLSDQRSTSKPPRLDLYSELFLSELKSSSRPVVSNLSRINFQIPRSNKKVRVESFSRVQVQTEPIATFISRFVGNLSFCFCKINHACFLSDCQITSDTWKFTDRLDLDPELFI